MIKLLSLFLGACLILMFAVAIVTIYQTFGLTFAITIVIIIVWFMNKE